jgi:DNA (cytosine-5)-methyltransferase 1
VLKLLDLFSGIGGFSLGLERTGGFETVAFCEIDKFCQKVLRKHWPHVRQYTDIKTLTAAQLTADGITVDAICGGFPCQDISTVGSGAGIEGPRSGLWKEYARIIGEVRPRYVLVENVAALLGRGLGRVLGDLAALGYDAEWHCISASHVGANHLRDRVWIAANPIGDGLQGRKHKGPILGEAALVEASNWQHLPATGGYRSRHGLPNYVDRIRALGNAVVPQIPELIGRAILAAEAASPQEE